MNPIVVVCFKRVLLRRWLIKLGALTLAEKPLCYPIDKFSVFSVRLKKNSKNRTLNVLHCIFVGKKGIAFSKTYLITIIFIIIMEHERGTLQ